MSGFSTPPPTASLHSPLQFLIFLQAEKFPYFSCSSKIISVSIFDRRVIAHRIQASRTRHPCLVLQEPPSRGALSVTMIAKIIGVKLLARQKRKKRVGGGSVSRFLSPWSRRINKIDSKKCSRAVTWLRRDENAESNTGKSDSQTSARKEHAAARTSKVIVRDGPPPH